MKQFSDPIHVEAAPDGNPVRVLWRNRSYRVRSVEERWRVCSKWWIDGVGIQRNYYGVIARGPNAREVTMEIYKSNRTWTLSGLVD